jgi:hypothetical protein
MRPALYQIERIETVSAYDLWTLNSAALKSRHSFIPPVYDTLHDFRAFPNQPFWITFRYNSACKEVHSDSQISFELVEVPSERVHRKRLILRKPPYQIQPNGDTLALRPPSKWLQVQAIPAEWKSIRRCVQSNAYIVTANAPLGRVSFHCTEYVTNPKTEIGLKVQKVLQKKGFYSGNLDGLFNSETKKALIEFQKYHQLPLGNLDWDTMKLLEISF